jgi:hypothetical protein
MLELERVKNLSEWRKTRSAVEAAVLDALGVIPPERVELQVKVLDEWQEDGFVRRNLHYFVDDWTRAPAWLFVPDAKEDMPALLCCHGRVPQGKDEPAGLEGEQRFAFARHYASLGYITIAPDAVTAGERVSAGRAPYDTGTFYEDYPQMSIIGKMLVDHMHAVDVLLEQKRVDSARIGAIGHGLGGFNALLLAALDERIQVCVAEGAFGRFQDGPASRGWLNDDTFLGLPALEEAAAAGRYPFDWEHLLALIAPHPTLIIGAPDGETQSSATSLGAAVKEAQRIYHLLGAEEAIKLVHKKDRPLASYNTQATAEEWFERWL